MKKTITLLSFILLILFHAVTASAQGYLEVYLNSGISQRFYLNDFKELRTSKCDTIGVLHSDYVAQEVVMSDSTYRFMMNEVDSIRFKKVTDEDIREDISTIAYKISPLMSNVSSITEASSHIEEIKSFKGVQDAYVSGMSLFVVMENICKLVYYYPLESTVNQTSLVKSFERVSAMVANGSMTGKKALVYNQLYRDQNPGFSAHSTCENLVMIFRNSGVDARYVTNEGDANFFYNTDFSEYDYIYLVTHGEIDKRGHIILTSEEIFDYSYNGVLDCVTELYASVYNLAKRIAHSPEFYITHVTEIRGGEKRSVYYLAINDNFIKSGKKATKHEAIMVNGACQSLNKNDDMYHAFYDRGIGYYLGYNDYNSVGDEIGLPYFSNMLNGMSAETALENLDNEFKHNFGTSTEGVNFNAFLRICHPQNSEKDLSKEFVFPVVTGNVDMVNNSISLEGKTTVYEYLPEILKCGFRYSNSKEMTSYEFVECEGPTLSANHELVFNASIPKKADSLPIYYQAYTYDGYNYNLGEVKSVGAFSTAKPEECNIGETSAYLGVKIQNLDGLKQLYGGLQEIGILYSTRSYGWQDSDVKKITIYDWNSEDGLMLGQAYNLKMETEYYYRAYVKTNDGEIIYGDIEKFVTRDEEARAELKKIYDQIGLESWGWFKPNTPVDKWSGVWLSEDGYHVYCYEARSIEDLELKDLKRISEISLPSNIGVFETVTILNCPNLKELSNYKTKHLEVQSCYKLTNLFTWTNTDYFETIDLSDCSNIQEIIIGFTDLRSLRVANCSSLKTISISETKLSSIEVVNCPNLEEFDCRDNEIEGTLNLSSDKLREIDCSNNKISSLNLMCPLLEKLDCYNNEITGTLNLSNAPKLEEVYCGYNNITRVKITSHNMSRLDCLETLVNQSYESIPNWEDVYFWGPEKYEYEYIYTKADDFTEEEKREGGWTELSREPTLYYYNIYYYRYNYDDHHGFYHEGEPYDEKYWPFH